MFSVLHPMEVVDSVIILDILQATQTRQLQ